MLQEMRGASKYIMWILGFAFVFGYLLLDTSGLLGTPGLTQGTVVGEVNGKDITYGQWIARANAMLEQQGQFGQLDGDLRAQIEDQAFEEIVMDIILAEEYKRRGITVTEDEILQAARFAPPPQMMQSPELQTDGRFDPVKWERFLSSPVMQQQGILVQLQAYYEDQIPREKLFSQIIGEVYVSDERLWRMYRDQNDSASISYVAFRPAVGADSAARSQVSDADVSAYYNANHKLMESPARAYVTALVIPRTPNAADTAATRERIAEVRARLDAGESFDALARELSDDTVSGRDGGSLGAQPRGALDSTFEAAARALRRGQISGPVATRFGLHLIQQDSVKADTLYARHILLRHRQTDSSATVTDRLADSVARIAGGSPTGEALDNAAAATGLRRQDLEIIEGQRAISIDGVPLPGLAQWAVKSGARVGEVSDLLDSEDAYFLARLDSLVPGGVPPLSRMRDQIRLYLARRHAVEALRADAEALASAAVSSSLASAAEARNLTVAQADPFTRLRFVPGIGQSNAAIGASFTLPVGAISAPIVTDEAVYVIRVDNRWEAGREAWQAQSETQRLELVQRLQQDRYRQYLAALREEANVEDKRLEVMAAFRAPPE